MENDQKSIQNPSKTHTYLRFDTDRLHNILEGWNGLGGVHGLVVKYCGNLLMGNTVLDIGCGGCHLYDLLQPKISRYVGVDYDKRILEWARERHPDLTLEYADVNDLSVLGNQKFDTVFAIGLFTHIQGTKEIEEMLKHTNQCLVFTYKNFRHPTPTSPFLHKLPDSLWKILERKNEYSLEIFGHGIHRNIEILRLKQQER